MSARRRQDVETDMRAQRLRHDDRAVGLLMVLEDRDEEARGGERAIERRDDLIALLALGARVEASGLEGRAVRGRGQLAIALLAREPRLTVELAGRALPEIAGRRVDDPLGRLHLG